MKTTWSPWRSFPDPRSGGMLTAPIGPGCYELRRRDGQLVLFGMAGHVADRMTSLLPAPFGSGTRRNSAKRTYVLENLALLEYRTIACTTREDAVALEAGLKANAAVYLFGEI